MKRGMVVLTGRRLLPTCTTRADEEHGVLRLHKMVRAYSFGAGGHLARLEPLKARTREKRTPR